MIVKSLEMMKLITIPMLFTFVPQRMLFFAENHGEEFSFPRDVSALAYCVHTW